MIRLLALVIGVGALSGHGNCTDFHSLFMSLARSQGKSITSATSLPIA